MVVVAPCWTRSYLGRKAWMMRDQHGTHQALTAGGRRGQLTSSGHGPGEDVDTTSVSWPHQSVGVTRGEEFRSRWGPRSMEASGGITLTTTLHLPTQ